MSQNRPRGLTQRQVAAWFMEHGQRQGTCLVWPARRRPQVHYAGFRLPLYRLVWAAQNGIDVLTLPSWIHVCHTCDNDHCFEPTHLFKGNAQVNMQDASAKGRLPARDNMYSPVARFTNEQVVQVRSLSTAGWSTRKIAQATGISKSHVHCIITGSRRPIHG